MSTSRLCGTSVKMATPPQSDQCENCDQDQDVRRDEVESHPSTCRFLLGGALVTICVMGSPVGDPIAIIDSKLVHCELGIGNRLVHDILGPSNRATTRLGLGRIAVPILQ